MSPLALLDPAFNAMILHNAPLLCLGDNFAWLEGPVWCADANQLLVSDLPNDRILRWTADGAISIFRSPSGFANGHARDRYGRLVGCSHGKGAITRTEFDVHETILADRYRGKRLNGPNDIIVHSDGALWFTDPLYGLSTDYEGGKRLSECAPAVYRFDPANGDLQIVANDFEGPNGLAFSPDEKRLYITETGPPFAMNPTQHIRAFDVVNGKTLANGRIFHKVSPGYADGIRIDDAGRLWSSAEDGVHCIDTSGRLLGKILTEARVSNLAFGGRHKSRLFICASHKLLAIYTNVRGAQFP